MSETKKTNAVAKKETNNMLAEMGDEFFADLPVADGRDYKIPNIVICQPTSTLDNNPGDIVDLNTKASVGKAGEPTTFVPLWFFKSWEIYEIDQTGRRKFLGKEVFSSANATWEWEEQTDDGKLIRRNLILNVFMILEKDINSAMPQMYLYKFKGKSSAEGKKLVTFWTNAKNYKQIPFSYVFSLTPRLVKEDDRKYYVADVANVLVDDKYKQIEGSDLQTAYTWVKMIRENLQAMTTANLDSDTEETTTTRQAGGPPSDGAPMPEAPPQNVKNYAPGAEQPDISF